jgi:hypothetical protein
VKTAWDSPKLSTASTYIITVPVGNIGGADTFGLTTNASTQKGPDLEETVYQTFDGVDADNISRGIVARES